MSPREPRRTTRKRLSGMRSLANGIEQCASGVFLGVANDGNANAQTIRNGAFGNGFGSVVGALGVDVGKKLFQELFDIGLGEDEDIVDRAKSGD